MQSGPHIGHLRGALVFDILRRWLDHRGYDVTFVRNVTDIDDKVLANAAERPSSGGRSPTGWSSSSRPATPRSASCRPTYEPRATASIPQMQELIARLIERGHAYAAADGSGDVYFDTASWPAYGELTRQNLDDMEAAADADPRGKRDPRDFALWKGAQGGRAGIGVLGVAVGRRAAGLAHRVLGDVAALPRRRSSTSTAADSTCASRTTRTSSPSRRPPATRSRATGCTTVS